MNLRLVYLILCAVIVADFNFVRARSPSKPRRHNEYEKYSIDTNRNANKVPTLESLFNIVTYWDNNNRSSPCTYVGPSRATHCHKIVTFDQEGYEKSLDDTRKLILSRLNLENEPNININQNTLSFLDQLENKLLNENDEEKDHHNHHHHSNQNSHSTPSHYSTLKTKYDMKSQNNKLFSSMHESSDVNTCGLDPEQANKLCIHFEIPVKSFVKELNGYSLKSRTSSVILWVFVRLSNDPLNDQMELEIKNPNNMKKLSHIQLKTMTDGWNTINITKIFKFTDSMLLNADEVISLSFTLTCSSDCRIGYSDDEFLDINDNYLKNIILSNNMGKKPLLYLNLEDNNVDHVEDLLNSKNANRRSKRKANEQVNFKAQGFDPDTYKPNYCQNNYPDANKECCLITYFVNFNSLKWSSWILSPNGFVANYCAGKCSDPRSFRYASHNAEVKLKYNEKLRSNESTNAGDMLETCCHPIGMDSLVVKYIASNGSVVSTVIPNMIVTGCGCS